MSKPEIYLVVTKSDLLDPSAEMSLPLTNKTFFQKLANYHGKNSGFQWASLSCCAPLFTPGSLANGEYPATPTPHGYEKIFRSIEAARAKVRGQRLVTRFARVALPAAIAAIGYWWFTSSAEDAEVQKINEAPIVELVQFCESKKLNGKRMEALDSRITTELQKSRKTVDNKYSSLGDLDTLLDHMEILRRLSQSKHHHQVENETNSLKAILQEKLFEQLVAENDMSTRGDRAQEFLKRFPTSDKSDEVRAILAEVQDTSDQMSINSIVGISVVDAASLREKVRRIEDFLPRATLSPRFDADDIEQMKRAMEIAGRVAAAQTARVQIKQVGYSEAEIGKHNFRILLFRRANTNWSVENTRKSEEKAIFREAKKSNPVLVNEDFDFYLGGTSFLLGAWSDEWGGGMMATKEVNLFRDLSLFNGEQITFVKNWPANVYFWVTGAISIDGSQTLDSTVLEAYSQFVSPGAKWWSKR